MACETAGARGSATGEPVRSASGLYRPVRPWPPPWPISVIILPAPVRRYEKPFGRRSKSEGSALEADGLDIPAIAALMLMNRDEDNVDEFLAAYRGHRSASFRTRRSSMPSPDCRPARSSTFAPRQSDSVFPSPSPRRCSADVTTDPRSTGTARRPRRPKASRARPARPSPASSRCRSNLPRRCDDGSRLAPPSPDSAWRARMPTLPRRSVPPTRGDARRFALAYAAQRQALARSKIDDADRFAPELAHEGTGVRPTRGRASRSRAGSAQLRSVHVALLSLGHHRGHTAASAGNPIYRDTHGPADRGSWWGGAAASAAGSGGSSGRRSSGAAGPAGAAASAASAAAAVSVGAVGGSGW